MSAVIVFILRLLLVIALYVFVGWALYTIWQDMRIQSRLVSEKKIPGIKLSILESDDIFEFHLTEVMIGRENVCDVSIANETVSSRHARLRYYQSQWWIEDMHSTNGTFLNDERVDTPTVILSGDEIRCGKVVLELSIL